MMRHKEVIYLLKAQIQEDAIGNQIEVLSERKVFANEFSVSSGEFYNAALADLRPAKTFELHTFEYLGEERLKHAGFTYRIIRTEGKGEKTRIVCERVGADG